MLVERNEEAELRELCATLAIQAGAKDAGHIIALAETLRKYIQFGAAVAAWEDIPNGVSEAPGFLSIEELSAENDT
jgi:hypothetical protein